jgi:hypothetical protein
VRPILERTLPDHVAREAPTEDDIDPGGPEPAEPGEEPLSPRADRLLSGLPFLFGGGLAIFLAFELRSAPQRSGIPPLWVLFLTLGVVALAAGLLLMLTSEPSTEEDDEETDRVVLPRKEWDHLQRELRHLRSAQARGAPTGGTRSSDPRGDPEVENRPEGATPPAGTVGAAATSSPPKR